MKEVTCPAVPHSLKSPPSQTEAIVPLEVLSTATCHGVTSSLARTSGWLGQSWGPPSCHVPATFTSSGAGLEPKPLEKRRSNTPIGKHPC